LNVVYAGLDQRSREELWMLVNHISSQLQGARSPAVTIATDYVDNPTVIVHSYQSICNLLTLLNICVNIIIVDWTPNRLYAWLMPLPSRAKDKEKLTGIDDLDELILQN